MASGTTITSTYVSPDSDINRLADGSTIASTDHAGNTALLGGSPNPSDTVTFDFGKKKPVNNVKVYFYNDRLEGGYGTPQQFLLEYLDADGNAWKPVQGQTRYPETIASNYNNVEFETVKTQAIRLRVTHALDAKTGIKEVQIYDNKLKNVAPAVNQAPKVYIGQTERTAAQDETVSILPAIYDDGLSGKELSYRWSKASGSGSVEEMQTDRAELKAVFHDVGEYVYTLTVSDGEKETAVDVHITVSVPTQDIVDMIHAYAPRDNGKIVRNKDDFTPESWDALQTALTEAKTLLAGQNYTREQVEAVRAKLKQASDGLQVKNVALLAKATTSYVSPWESIAGVNDGYIPYTSASIGKPEDEVQYGNWADPAESHWLLYTWDRPVKLSQSSIYFYDDGGGVKVPADYSLEYWDQASNEFKPVTGLSGKAMNKDRFNDVSFDEITTTKLRLHLIRQSGAWTGVKEWRVLGPEAVAGNPGNGSNKPVLSIDPVEVETVIGVAPQLPATVNVTFADQTKGTKPVTWNEVPYNELTTAHSFVVLGRVEGTEQSASCRITVTYDKTELKSLIGQARDMLDHQEQYEATPEQWKALKDALAAAQTAADDKSATEGDIKAAAERLKTALDTFNIQK
ncbi:discoidin domain-containing protein [Paenibacillus cookii]|nr:discoidin domain-containing protein [Paenibacillus cookii]